MLTGELFVEEGLISSDQLRMAMDKQVELGGSDPIARVLVDMGLIAERDRVRCLGKVWGIPFADLSVRPPQPEALAAVPVSLARRFKCLPLEVTETRLIVAMANPLDIFLIDELRLTTGLEIEPMIAVEDELQAALSDFYSTEAEVGKQLDDLVGDIDLDIVTTSPDDDDGDLGEDDAPVIKLAHLIINQAVTDKASDIHIEPRKDAVVVRYRIDGVMLEAMRLPRKVAAPLVSRIKIMANMDIAEKRAPQDNRIGATFNGKPYDFRVSTLPCVFGEKVVMRVLDKSNVMIGLNKLGLLPHCLHILEDMSSKSYGILLVTGPTGSGKSTTLYSLLNKVNTGSSNIITIEDPVEYEISGINQCNVNVRAGMTFAAGLRAMLRQDPDIIMVGEMRDEETATIAMEAALTGHFVLSTLHTNDAPSAPTRLIDMGVEPFLISSSIVGVLAQRLVRQICPNCKEATPSNREALVRLGLPVPEDLGADTGGDVTLFRGAGCEKCKGTGYKGRTGVHELMELTDDIRNEVLRKSPAHVLRNLAVGHGMKTLQEDGVQKLLMGVTTIDELIRVLYA